MAGNFVSLNPDTFIESWSCGGFMTMLGPRETRMGSWYCRSARCQTCGPLIQKMHFYKISMSLEALSRAPILFHKTITGLSRKALSNTLQRQARGAYVCITSSPTIAVIVSTHQLLDRSANRIHRKKLYQDLLPSSLGLLRNGGGRVSLSTQVNDAWKSLCGSPQGTAFVDSRLQKDGLSNEEIGLLWRFWDSGLRRGAGLNLAAVPGRRLIHWHSRTPLQRAMYLANKWRTGAKIYKRGQTLIMSLLILTLLGMRLAQMQRIPFPLKSYLKRLIAMLP